MDFPILFDCLLLKKLFFARSSFLLCLEQLDLTEEQGLLDVVVVSVLIEIRQKLLDLRLVDLFFCE